MDAVEIVETANTERKLAMYDSERTARTHKAHAHTSNTRVCVCVGGCARVCASRMCRYERVRARAVEGAPTSMKVENPWLREYALPESKSENACNATRPFPSALPQGRARKCTYTYTYAYIESYAHTHTHTHTHICMYIYFPDPIAAGTVAHTHAHHVAAEHSAQSARSQSLPHEAGTRAHVPARAASGPRA